MSKKTRRGAVGQIRYYETVVVIDPQIGDDTVKNIVEKTKEVITHSGAVITKVEEWGKRKLAYAIKKKTYGHYVCIEFEGGGDVVKHLQEYYHITEDILRYLTILVDSRLREERKRERVLPAVQEEILV
jgi:small subunit ribosomal protein S6